MRLGQLARKYDIPVQEIIDYLNEETGEKFHPNAKLYDAVEEQIFKHFDLYPDNPILEPEESADEEKLDEGLVEPVQEDLSPEEDIALAEGELAITTDSNEILEDSEVTDVSEPVQPEPNEDEVIQTDKLLELLENEEENPNLEKVKLIKAPKKELPGLKVLGKVDLPEPKKKTQPEDQKEQSKRSDRKRRPQLSEEEKEKRRLKAKRKKEAYEARQEKRRKEQEARRLKELKARHYQEKLRKAEINKQKKEDKKTKPEAVETPLLKKHKKEPKTWLGKWWRWMNT